MSLLLKFNLLYVNVSKSTSPFVIYVYNYASLNEPLKKYDKKPAPNPLVFSIPISPF